MAITQNELDLRFDLHPATPATGPHMDANRAVCKQAAQEILKRTPESREQSLAITALEEALFWANAAIARHGLTEGIVERGPEKPEIPTLADLENGLICFCDGGKRTMLTREGLHAVIARYMAEAESGQLDPLSEQRASHKYLESHSGPGDVGHGFDPSKPPV